MTTKSTLYIDESGKSSLKEVKNNPFIMTGVIISDPDVISIEGYFNYIKRRFNINPNKPFHSYHIFEHPKEKLNNSHLRELSKTLSDFIDLIPAKIKILEVDKQSFRETLGIKSNNDFKGDSKRKELSDFPYRVMASTLFAWFGNYLNENNSVGQIIADSRRGADHQLLKTLNLCKEGHIPFVDTNVRKNIDDRVTAICFSEKNYLSGGLEITDLISYIAFFKVRRLLSANKHLGIETIWSSINKKTSITKFGENDVRRFFGLKKNEVHKYLRN